MQDGLEVNLVREAVQNLLNLSGEQGGAAFAVVVGLPGYQRREARRGVFDFDVVDAFQEGQPFAPVVRVGADLRADVLRAVERHEGARAGAVEVGLVGRLIPAVGAVVRPPRDQVFVHVVGHPGDARELADCAGARLAELGAERVAQRPVRAGHPVLVARLEMRQPQPRARVGDADLFQRLRRVDGEVQAGGGVLAGELVAGDVHQNLVGQRAAWVVVERHALAQRERDHSAVVVHFPRGRQIGQYRARQALPGVVLDQRVVRRQELRTFVGVSVVGVVSVEFQVGAVLDDAAVNRVSPLGPVAVAVEIRLHPVGDGHRRGRRDGRGRGQRGLRRDRGGGNRRGRFSRRRRRNRLGGGRGLLTRGRDRRRRLLGGRGRLRLLALPRFLRRTRQRRQRQNRHRGDDAKRSSNAHISPLSKV